MISFASRCLRPARIWSRKPDLSDKIEVMTTRKVPTNRAFGLRATGTQFGPVVGGFPLPAGQQHAGHKGRG